MRVFVTGATGFIGSAVVRELIAARHQVVGLARSDRSAAALAAVGAEAQRGSIEDLDSVRRGAAGADGVIHLAFNNDFRDYAGAAAAEQRAVEAMGAALAGSGKPFVVTSGTLAVASLGRVATERDLHPGGTARAGVEDAVSTLAKQGVRSSAVRLAPCVHDASRQGLASQFAGLAREKGVSAYIGDGSNRWPAVHVLDAARLFRLALESAPAGSIWHGAGEEGIPFLDIAEAIGRKVGVPVVSLPRAEADKHFGFFANVVSVDDPTSSALTQEQLGWKPQEPTLIADIGSSHASNQ